MEKLVQLKSNVFQLRNGCEAEFTEREETFEVKNKTDKNYVVKREGAKGHISVPVLEVDTRTVSVVAHRHNRVDATVWCTPEEVPTYKKKMAEELLGKYQEINESVARCFGALLESGYFDGKSEDPAKSDALKRVPLKKKIK